jgi:hypothetical protein
MPPKSPQLPPGPTDDPHKDSAVSHDKLRVELRPSVDPLPPGSIDLPRGMSPFDVPRLRPARVLDRVPFRPPRDDSAGWSERPPQRLVPVDTTPNIDEGIEARVKDPLWFLARQWQTGEFHGENGGRVAQIEVAWHSSPVSAIVRDGAPEPIDLAQPLEETVEAETPTGASPAWRADRLAYTFTLQAGGAELVADEYNGSQLDWYHFDLRSQPTAKAGAGVVSRLLPKNLRFQGMPHPRWWRFEPADVDLSRIASARPNQLQLLLAEFLMIDSNNWYVLPLELPAGHLRRIDRCAIVDAFGVVTEISPALGPAGSNDWELFSLTSRDGASGADGSWFYVPHAAINVTEADLVEQIEFMRDEMANVGWAVERYYTNNQGLLINRGDEESLSSSSVDGLADPATLTPEQRTQPVYRLSSLPPRHWIPYVPRRAPVQPVPLDPQVYLRRGRTDPSASRAAPQHRTRIVAECWRLKEEELPRTGVAVERRWRYARRTDGSLAVWVGRRKDFRTAERSANVDFDFLMSPR